MTADSGISNFERFEDSTSVTGALKMIQIWVALPEKDEEAAPLKSIVQYFFGMAVAAR